LELLLERTEAEKDEKHGFEASKPNSEDSEFKTTINEFDNDIRRHSKEDEEHGFEA
jgi:hypothetical protein